MTIDLVAAVNMNIHSFREQTGINVNLDVSGTAECIDIKPNVRISVLYLVGTG